MLANDVWADGPGPTPRRPDKAEIRAWGTGIEQQLANLSMAQIKTVSTTAYSVVADDVGKVLNFTASTPVSVNVPSGLGAGFFAMLVQSGAGAITVSGASGVSVLAQDGALTSPGQYGVLSLLSVAANSFRVFGGAA